MASDAASGAAGARTALGEPAYDVGAATPGPGWGGLAGHRGPLDRRVLRDRRARAAFVAGLGTRDVRVVLYSNSVVLQDYIMYSKVDESWLT